MSATRDPSQAELQPLLQCFNTRRYDEMERAARALLLRFPDSGLLCKALGVALQAQGKEAIETLRRARTLLPDDAELPSNLGNLLSQQGLHKEALACYRDALALRPDFAEAHGNLGLALMRAGRLDDALPCLQRALQLKPGFVEAHCNLGLVLQRLGRLDEALQAFERALALKPDFAAAQALLDKALFDAAHALAAQGQTQAAIARYQRLLQRQPGHLPALCNLGLLLQGLGRFAEAAALYRRGLELDPAATELLNNLGNTLKAQGLVDEALPLYRRAIAARPSDTLAHANLAAALRELGDFDGAAHGYQRILALQPEQHWAHSDLLFLRCHREPESPAATRAAAARYGATLASLAPARAHWPNAAEPARCLRVGLVSADLREHPVGYFLQSLLTALAAQAGDQLSLIAYANNAQHDGLSAALKASAAGWRQVQDLSDAQLAAQIEADGIDILVDLSGHTAGNRLPAFARKPAPLQLSWLGYCASTGVAAIDHVLCDPWIAPPGMEAAFTEGLWRLPESFLCFTPPTLPLPVAPLPAATRGQLTFGCFNKFNKLNDAVLRLWAELLAALPGSRLYLKNAQLDVASTRAGLQARLAALGIPAERLWLEGASPRTDYLRCYADVDIALDPFPYPGGTTSMEALWMGVPVLTLAGSTPLARQGVSIMQNLQLPDWVAADRADYLTLAQRHAADLQTLAALRQGLRARLLRSPLCDAPRFATHFEAALRQLWRQWCEQKRKGPDQVGA
ncbi:O-linked N-acetylglucosamine transferase, SPINDLY family protein [Paucibacter soli]|uniref:O-linked N-acetylglucosamine transferase, SPINDLY family protein n=1 Tax=Paucibacter soli TaxID=3133433 RepID=UPI0030A12B6F